MFLIFTGMTGKKFTYDFSIIMNEALELRVSRDLWGVASIRVRSVAIRDVLLNSYEECLCLHSGVNGIGICRDIG